MAKKILHLADLHLGSKHTYLGADASARAVEADGVIDRLADWVTTDSSEVGAILIAGDLFDTPWPEEKTVARAVRALERITRHGIGLVTVPGNHDEWTYRDGVFRKWEAAWPGVLVTQSEPTRVAVVDLDDRSVEIVSCAYQQGCNLPSSRWANPFVDERGSNVHRIGLFHGTLDRLGGVIQEGERAFALDFARLARWDLDYLALGHIHKSQEFRDGRCLAFYPGPIEGRGFDDPGTSALCLIDFTEGMPRIEQVRSGELGIRCREVMTLDIDLVRMADSAAVENTILSTIETLPTPPILRVALKGRADFSISKDRLVRLLAAKCFHLEIVGDDSSETPTDWRKLATQKSLEGLFTKRILELETSATSAEEQRILNATAAAGLRAFGRDRR